MKSRIVSTGCGAILQFVKELCVYNIVLSIYSELFNSKICMPKMTSCTLLSTSHNIDIHHSRKVWKPCSGLSSYSLQWRLMKVFNSAKNSSIGLRSGKGG